MIENFWKMGGLSLFTVPYVYVDHHSHLADNLFAERRIKMRFKGDYRKEGSPYVMVFCRVRSRDIGRFEEALEKLTKKMLLFGYRDYGDVCGRFARMINDAKKRKNGKDSS